LHHSQSIEFIIFVRRELKSILTAYQSEMWILTACLLLITECSSTTKLYNMKRVDSRDWVAIETEENVK